MPARNSIQNALAESSEAGGRRWTLWILQVPGLARTLRHIRQRFWFWTLLLAIGFVITYFLSAGFVEHWPVYGTYHDLQAEGFRLWQTHVPLTPAPELLAAENPYSPVNMRYWVLDLSYYQGKYYIYWGPFPALLQAIAKSILGIRGMIGDHYLSLFFLCTGSIAGAYLLERVARRLFPSVSKAILALSILAFALGGPALHAASTASTYYAAILGAQWGLVVGLVPAFDAVWRPDGSAMQKLRMVLASVCWGLALASRVTVGPTIAVLILTTAVASGLGATARFRSSIVNTVWLGVPASLIGLALFAFNKIRFDDGLEFGLHLQLSAFPAIDFSSRFWLPNLYSYLLRPFELSCQFPWVLQVWRMGLAAFPQGFSIPQDYMILEPVIGLLYSAPIVWLIPCVLLIFARLRAGLRRRMTLWCLIVFGAIGSIMGLINLGVYGATMRYANDVAYGLALLGAMGAFVLQTSRLGRLLPKATSTLAATLCVATITMGLLIGYQGYNGQFLHHNRPLHAKLVRALSFCGDDPPKSVPYSPF